MSAETLKKNADPSLVHAPELHHLNVEHSFPLVWQESPPRGWLGRLFWPLIKRLRIALFGEFFVREQQYYAQLVRHLNALTAAVDPSANLRAAQELRTQVETLKNELRKHELQLSTLDSVSRGLERIISRINAAPPAAAAAAPAPAIDYSYLLLENRYRGSEEEIRTRLSRYPEIFSGSAKAVLEIGAGRGELQQLFREQGISSYGLDLDQAMVERCREQGLDVRLENGLSHLEQLSPQSLGGLIAVQVIEHLSYGQLKTLFALCRSRIARGGKIVFETVNAASIAALCKNYFRDPTHTFPLHPETTRFLMELSGIKVVEIEYLSPYPESALLQDIPELSELDAAAREAINHNARRLNHELFGFQDYCIIGEIE